MTDREIVSLYHERNELAIVHTKTKYERYCQSISLRILGSPEDADECVADAFLRAWNAIPPAKPENLATFLGKIVRNLSLNRYEKLTAQKRGSSQVEIAWSELEECLCDSETPLDSFINQEIREHTLQVMNKFLSSLKKHHRMIFVSRYWHLNSIEHIAESLSLSESNVKQILFRTRNKLKSVLQKEGIFV